MTYFHTPTIYDWTDANRRARLAYYDDMLAEQGICITCHRPHRGDARRCGACLNRKAL